MSRDRLVAVVPVQELLKREEDEEVHHEGDPGVRCAPDCDTASGSMRMMAGTGAS